MFSTILKEVTGYFNRQALISAFFPSLVFWALTVIIVLAQQMGWSEPLKKWEGLGGTIQALLLIGFFFWVSFWSFLTLNFQTTLVRLYEGYWLDTKPITLLSQWRRERWQKHWDKLDCQDRKLEQQEIALLNEQEEYEELRRSLETVLAKAEQMPPENADQVGEELDEFLNEAKVKLKADLTSISELAELGQTVRGWWCRLVPYLKAIGKNHNNSWTQHQRRLDDITGRLEEIVKRQLGEVEEQRLRLNHQLFLYYPPKRSSIMPTQLGNVLKATEMYAQERYHLDAILIWPRLQPDLPKEFGNRLQTAKTSLELMVTLSALTLLFGFPLSVWLAFQSSMLLAWRIPLFIGVIASVLLLAWLNYQNAVRASLAYGEKIKAALDLYRWKVIEGLHLQLPPDFEEERRLWEEVCGLLYRGYKPDPHYYRYVRQKQTKDFSFLTILQQPEDTVAVGIPATPSMALGGDLKPGDVVDLILIQAATEAHPSPTPLLFENIFVLDVKSVHENKAVEGMKSNMPFVVVVALPIDHRGKFASHSAGGTFLIFRKNTS